MQYLDRPFEVKALGEDGSFSGWASVFGNVDQQGEVVMPGAFKQINVNTDGRLVVLWQHDQRNPIGTAAVHEDAKGLAFNGSLVLEDPMARKARAHMLAKSVRGMSIGYSVIKDEIKAGVRYLQELKLHEISVVTFGANALAGVAAVKDALAVPEFTSIREAEFWFRDELGFSKSAAAELIAKFKRALIDPDEAHAQELAACLAALKSCSVAPRARW
jgi:uncharacterized protein